MYKTAQPFNIDGELDTEWNPMPALQMEKWMEGLTPADNDSDLSATFRIAWDDDYLYTFFEIIDDHVYFTDNLSEPWALDCLEFYFDGDNDKGESYDENDFEWRYVYGWYDGGPGIIDAGTLSWLKTEFGYNFELAIPFDTVTFDGIEGHVFGFEVDISDNDEDEWQHVLRWWSEDAEAWNTPSIFGTAQLSTFSPINIAPVITSIKDIPNDDGRWVRVEFMGSVYDTAFTSTSGQYHVEIKRPTGWDVLELIQAMGLGSYTADVPIPDNSKSYDFRVRAVMLEGEFMSNIVTFPGTDEIPPAAPVSFTTFISDTSVEIIWEENTEPDFAFYSVYKGEDDSTFNLMSTTRAAYYGDAAVLPGHTYYYRISATDSSGNESEYSEIITVNITDIYENQLVPMQYRLLQNYPNPFNPETLIRYSIPEAGHVDLSVYNVLGQKVETLVSRQQAPGSYLVNFRASALAAGIYYYKLETESKFTLVKRMVLLK
ncbi:MAG: sugar-binding protein [Calditrichaceae bacterium]